MPKRWRRFALGAPCDLAPSATRQRAESLPTYRVAHAVSLFGDQVSLVLLCAAEFGAGYAVMVLAISIGSIFAAAIPHRLRSRVSGAYGVVSNGVRPIGALVGGALGAWIGVRETLWLVTVSSLTGVLFVLRGPLVRLRELPESSE